MARTAAVFGALWAAAPAFAAPPDGAVFAVFVKWIPYVLTGFALNLAISFVAMALGTAAGLGLGLLQVSPAKPVRIAAGAVMQFFRNSPWLVLLFCIMLMTPYQVKIGGVIVPIPDWIKAAIGLSLPVMANLAEIVRGAVQSIPTAQWESAAALAYTRGQTMRKVILPQCLKRMLPPWMNWYAILTMATPLCSIMGVEEAVRHTRSAIEAEGGRPDLLLPFYTFLLVIFFVYCYPIARWTIHLERRYAVRH